MLSLALLLFSGLVNLTLSVCALPSINFENERQLVDFNLPESEMLALQALYSATDGPSWACCEPGTVAWNFTNVSANPCNDNWQGITCFHSTLYSVSQIDLKGHNLSGTLPNSLANLSQLAYLELSSNHLNGTLPSSFGNLTLLKQLYVSSNTLDGSIPDSWNGMSLLQYLYLDNNLLSGTIPSMLGNLTSLEYIDISINYLVGSIPSSLGDLSGLLELLLTSNDVSGPIPDTFGKLTAMTSLYIETTYVHGTLPSSLGNLTNMIEFFVDSNFITGTIPESFNNLTRLIYFDIEENYLEGTVPTFIGDFRALNGLYLDVNSFSGTVPSSFGKLLHLEDLYLDTNVLTGTLPESLGNLIQLSALFMNDNYFTGTVPNNYSNLVLVSSFYLNDNLLTGTIPSSFGSLAEVLYFYLSVNSLSGTIPSSFGMLAKVQFFEIGGNDFTGTVPSSLSNCTSLVNFNAEFNDFSGDLHTLFNASTQTQLSGIQVNNNQLTGNLPKDVFRLINLNNFVASVNCFQGTLPSTICKANNTQELILDGLSSANPCRNEIFPGLADSYILSHSVHGSLPSCIFSLPHLFTLHLSGNGFTGVLPSNLELGEFLVNLDVSHNTLSGSIDETIQIRDWSQLNMAYNRISGTLLDDFKSQEYATVLSLENNRLSGNIPGSVLDLVNISILGNNIFYCSIDNSDLPPNDSGKYTYQCGSNEFDIQYYFWLFIVACVCGFVVVVMFFPKMRPELFPSKEVIYQWLSYTSPIDEDATSLTGLGQLLDSTLRISFFSACFMVLCLMPMYCVLGVYYGTYTRQYAYIASAAFISGVLPFAFEIFLWSCFLFAVYLLSAMFLFQKHDSDNRRISQINIDGGDVTVTLWQNIVINVVYIFTNLVIVGGVNAAYVLASIYGDSSLLLLEQVVLSLFKLMWNNFCNPVLLRLIGRFATPLLSKSRSFPVRFANLQVVIAVVDNILLPLLVVMVISPNCFYNVFVAAPAVNSTYLLSLCTAVSFETGQCLSFDRVPVSGAYYPPFEYNYQCSSSFVTYYSPIFVSMCIISSVLVPCGKLVLLFLHGLPEGSRFKLADYALPRLLRLPNSDDNNGSNSHPVDVIYCNTNRVIMILSTYLGILFTFGVVFPPLAVSLTFTLFVIAYSLKLEIGRFVAATLNVRGYEHLKGIIETECVGLGSVAVIQTMLWVVITVSSLFYTLFLFDSLGDSQNSEDSYWVQFLVLIVVPLLPLCLFLFLRGAWWRVPSSDHKLSDDDYMSTTDKLSRDTEMSVSNRDTEMSRLSTNLTAAKAPFNNGMDDNDRKSATFNVLQSNS